MPRYFTAIVVINAGDRPEQFLKYRNIPNRKTKLVSFLKFLAVKLKAHHANLYDAESRKFVAQVGKANIESLTLPTKLV